MDTHVVTYYLSIGRVSDYNNTNYINVLADFKTDHDAYSLLWKQYSLDTTCVNDKDKEKNIIKWVPLFKDALSRTFGSKGTLVYVIHESAIFPDETDDPLDAESHYGAAGSLLEELIQRLPHDRPIFKDDNKTVFMMISKASACTSVESTIKSFSWHKDGWDAFLALITNNAGDTKYRAIVKARNNLLQNIKWNGISYPLEQYVSNHQTAVDDIRECSLHIGNAVPNIPQQVEYFIEYISSQDNTLHATMGNIRAKTNRLCSDFKATSRNFIEVYPYNRSSNPPNENQQANVSSITFTGRWKTVVDFLWNTQQDFCELSEAQKDELRR